ncbi:MAG: DUF4347 domain-containing protein, partial [bacterium]|nr:DUF4347 domain-containing protein [bacterium]
FWQNIGGMIQENGRIDLLACNLAAGTNGALLIASLESVAGINFAASTNATGNPENGGDWILETDNINAENYFDSGELKNYSELMWSQVQKVDLGDEAADVDRFGFSVSLSLDGSTALIGAHGVDSNKGAAYIFEKGDTWAQTAKLTASGGVANIKFGFSVSLSSDGSTALIGANGDDSSKGSAYIFEKGDSWTDMTQTAKLTASDGAGGDKFGYSVSVSSDGSTALIGAYRDDSDVGSAYIFEKSGDNWAQTAKLTAS